MVGLSSLAQLGFTPTSSASSLSMIQTKSPRSGMVETERAGSPGSPALTSCWTVGRFDGTATTVVVRPEIIGIVRINPTRLARQIPASMASNLETNSVSLI